METSQNEWISDGLLAFAHQEYHKCIELITKGLVETPGHKLGLVSRGAAYLKIDQTDDAIADFDSALALDGHYARAYHLRGLAVEKQGDDEAALEDFHTAINEDPDYGAAYHSRATLYAKMGQDDLAFEDMKMVALLTNRNIEEFANEHNIWRSEHLRVEEMEESELNR